jgi:hypothetical protein
MNMFILQKYINRPVHLHKVYDTKALRIVVFANTNATTMSGLPSPWYSLQFCSYERKTLVKSKTKQQS